MSDHPKKYNDPRYKCPLMTTTQELQVQRYRGIEEKLSIQSKIAELRLRGLSFELIGGEIGLSERQVRRHFKSFFEDRLNDLVGQKRELFSKLLYEYEHSLESANTLLEQAKQDGNQAKIAVFMKIRQECLRDYRDFLDWIGLFKGILEEPVKVDVGPVELVRNEYKQFLKEKLNEISEKKVNEKISESPSIPMD